MSRPQTPGEEALNALTHFAGFGLGIAVLVILVVSASARGDPWRIVSYSIYGACLIMLYGASALYHAVPHGAFKRAMNKVDHVSIFLLIAGTYTPFLLVPLRGGWGWSIFGTVWGIAMIGIGAVDVLHRMTPLRVALYILLGWIILIAIVPVTLAIPRPAIELLVAGGLAYTSGVYFFASERLPFHHAIWHLFVLGGSACHVLALVLVL